MDTQWRLLVAGVHLFLQINFFFVIFLFPGTSIWWTLQIWNTSTSNALKACFFCRVLPFTFARWNLHNKNLHSKSMTYSSVIGSRRSNPYSLLNFKFCSFASIRRGGKMCCDVVLWIELITELLGRGLAQTEREQGIPLFWKPVSLTFQELFALRLFLSVSSNLNYFHNLIINWTMFGFFI